MNNSKQRLVLIMGSILIIMAGAVLILSAVPMGGTPAPTPRTAQPVAVPTAAGEIPYPEIVRVTLGAAKAAYDLKQAVFVDVRDGDSYANSHIPGALSIPLNNLETRWQELDKKAWILTYCT